MVFHWDGNQKLPSQFFSWLCLEVTIRFFTEGFTPVYGRFFLGFAWK
jgi:hypothetical protein